LSPIVDQVKAEWAERIEMDAAIPIKRDVKSVSQVAGQAWDKAKKTAAQAAPSH
jgi:hypothetical protein